MLLYKWFWNFFKFFYFKKKMGRSGDGKRLKKYQKGLNLGERPSPLFHLLLFFVGVCYIIGVSWPGRDLKRWTAANSKCIKNKNTAKINLPLGQAWLLLSTLFDTARHGPLISQEKFRKVKLQKLHIYSSQPRVGKTTKLPTQFILSQTIQRCLTLAWISSDYFESLFTPSVTSESTGR